MKVYGTKHQPSAIRYTFRTREYSFLRTNSAQRKVIGQVYPRLKGCKVLITDLKGLAANPEFMASIIEADIDLAKLDICYDDIRNWEVTN